MIGVYLFVNKGYRRNDYYPFGMQMPGRKYAAGNDYKYGFNGKEKDKDIGVEGQDYGMRIYDDRLGRFLSVDPLSNKFAYYTPYQFAGNKPIWCIDLDGLEDIPTTGPAFPPPYSVEYFVNWAKKDAFYTAPKDRNETVILIQTYYILRPEQIGNPNIPASQWKKVERKIILNEGDFGKPINYITQSDGMFTENGYALNSNTLSMSKTSINSKDPNYIETFSKETKKSPSLSLSSPFEVNSTQLQDEKKTDDDLSLVVDLLKKNKNAKVILSGNTKSDADLDTQITFDGKQGTVSELQLKRAGAIKERLIKAGVSEDQIETKNGKVGNTNVDIKIDAPKTD